MEVLIIPIEKSLILRARGSELLILDHHVSVLKGLTKSKDFIDYFNTAALVNRSARKLFEAWLRKDTSLWKRIFETIGGMEVEVVKASGPIAPKAPVVNPKAEEPAKPAKKAEVKEAAKEPVKAKAPEKENKPAKEKAVVTKKAPAKPAKSAGPAKKIAKKTVKKNQTTSAKKKTSSKA